MPDVLSVLSGRLGTFGQLEQQSKACQVDGHRQRGLPRDLDGFRCFSPHPSEPGCGYVAVLGCVLGGEQSGELGTFGGLQQHNKACPVVAHRQSDLLRDLNGF